MAFIHPRCFSDADYDAGDWKNTGGNQCDICRYYIFLQDIYAFSHVRISNFLSAGSIITSDAEDNDYCKSTLYSYCDCKRMYYGADISRLEVVGNCKCVCRWMLSGRERLF